MAASTKDSVLAVSLVLSVVSLVLLFGVTWYFQSSLSLLQQEVEYDRELLVKLQEQVKTQYVTTEAHDITRRQNDECQCKDGIPGPKGPPGEKGSMGKDGTKGDTGPRGDPGYRGPRGVLGDQGYPGRQGGKGKQGKKGESGKEGPRGQQGLKGQKGADGPVGDTGPRGDPGDRGPRGVIGDQGYPGPVGSPGETGEEGPMGRSGNDGSKGDKGDVGPKGDTGDAGLQGIQGPQGEKGEAGLQGVKGEIGHQGMKGENGLPGPTGLTGPPGAVGLKGSKGDKEERNGGTVYVRWGHDECPSIAKLVYKGRAGGAKHDQGSGSNPQCLPLNPEYLRTVAGTQSTVARIYGAQYHTNDFDRVVHDYDVPCAVCYVSQRSTVYMIPARYNCPSGWTREYHGYLMAERYDFRSSQFTCMDKLMTTVPNSAVSRQSTLLSS